MNEWYDLIIIGAGPAGLTAAIYAKRSRNKVLLLEKGAPGGKLNLYSQLDNYPGVFDVSAQDLAYKMYEQAMALGIEVTYGDVISLCKENDLFKIKSDEGDLFAKTVIIASGTSEKKMGVPGEDQFIGRGVSYCATCDAAFFRGKDVAVIGQSSKALEETFVLADQVRKVYLVSRTDKLLANPALIEKLADYPNIELIKKAYPYQIVGTDVVNAIKLRSKQDFELQVSAVFPFIGSIPNTSFNTFKETMDEQGYLKVDHNLETSISGLFGAGDVNVKTLRQIVTATGDGALAAFNAGKIIRKMNIPNF